MFDTQHLRDPPRDYMKYKLESYVLTGSHCSTCSLGGICRKIEIGDNTFKYNE